MLNILPILGVAVAIPYLIELTIRTILFIALAPIPTGILLFGLYGPNPPLGGPETIKWETQAYLFGAWALMTAVYIYGYITIARHIIRKIKGN